MIQRWMGWMADRGSWRMITRDGADYLERFYLLAVGPLRVFLHVFWMDDPDPPHDHPWPFGRVILSGAYREHYHDGTWRDFGPGHVLPYRDARVLHRVELITPRVVTLFWHWRRRRDWGFLYPGGWQAVPEGEKDGRPMSGWLFPRKLGRVPREVRT